MATLRAGAGMTVSIAQQIEEAKREIALREKVYPHQVRTGKMRQSVAGFHMDRMLAVLRTLEFVRDNEETIRAAVKAKLGEAA